MADIASVLAERLVEKGIVTDVDDVASEEDEVDEVEGAEGEAPETEVAGEDDSEESSDITSLVDLAKHLEVDPSFLYGLKIKLSETGEEVSIGSIKDRLQDAERSTRTVEKERSEISAERTAMVNAWSSWRSQQQQLDKAGLEAQNEMLMAEAEFRRIDWEALEKIDPGRTALEQQKIQRRYAEAESKLVRSRQALQQAVHHATQEARDYHDRMLVEAVPEWKDQERSSKDAADLVSWAKNTYKFNDQDFAAAVDWRARDVLRKAWLYDKMTTEKAATLATPPKQLIKKGIALKKSDTGPDSKQAKLIAKARATGRTVDKVTAARSILDRAFGTGKR